MQEQALPRPTIIQVIVPGEGLLRDVILIAAFATLIAISAQVTIPLPFTPVPVTGQTFAVLLTGAALGSVRGGLSVLTYVGVGSLGLPIFARSGGPATYGYIAGFVIAAFIAGWLSERGWDRSYWRSVLAMAIADAVIYVPGLIVLANFVGAEKVLEFGLIPFIPGDAVKLLAAAAALPTAWKFVEHK